MSTTINRTLRVLRSLGWHAYFDGEDILVPWGTDGNFQPIVVTVHDDGALIRFVRLNLFRLQDNLHCSQTLLRMSEASGCLKLAYFGTNCETGDAYAAVEVVLGPTHALHPEQAGRAMAAITAHLDPTVRALTRLLNEGRWVPDEDDAETEEADTDSDAEVEEGDDELLTGLGLPADQVDDPFHDDEAIDQAVRALFENSAQGGGDEAASDDGP